jgi:hypothetical protein
MGTLPQRCKTGQGSEMKGFFEFLPAPSGGCGVSAVLASEAKQSRGLTWGFLGCFVVNSSQ